MQHVKELFTDCTDVFEELIAVKTHLAQKIGECQSAVENIQSSLSKLDATQPQVETEIKVSPVQSLSAVCPAAGSVCISLRESKSYSMVFILKIHRGRGL